MLLMWSKCILQYIVYCHSHLNISVIRERKETESQCFMGVGRYRSAFFGDGYSLVSESFCAESWVM